MVCPNRYSTAAELHSHFLDRVGYHGTHGILSAGSDTTLNAISEPISMGDQEGLKSGILILWSTFNLTVQSVQVYLFIFLGAVVVAVTEMMLRKAK